MSDILFLVNAIVFFVISWKLNQEFGEVIEAEQQSGADLGSKFYTYNWYFYMIIGVVNALAAFFI